MHSVSPPTSHELDLARMRRERLLKLRRAMEREGIDALLLLTSGSVLYATGAWMPAVDNGRATHQRVGALVLRDDASPHLFTPYAEGAPPELPSARLHAPLWPETDAGVQGLARRVAELLGAGARRIAVDDWTAPMWLRLRQLLAPIEIGNALPLVTACRLHKTPDEQECMRRSWWMNEAASQAAEQALRPGVRMTELTGIYLRRLLELGATCNFLDPVFQIMPERIADGPWSTNGDVPFALVTADHVARHGDVVWTDTVSGYEGYASDVGRTWVVGRPSPVLRDLYLRWQEITDAVVDAIRPGATGAELARVATRANGGKRPWLDHYFLGHTLGLEGGEPQRFGSDAGPEVDEKLVLEPGMAVVIEPVTWKDGHGGWRCEELLFVTGTGCEKVSRYRNEPFE
jgi:Xaa-Pro aminopeptidase